MSVDNTIQFTNPEIAPTDILLANILGESFLCYQKLLEFIRVNQLIHEWNYYKDGKAWLLKIQKKKTTIIWISVWKGFFQATVYINEKYLDNLYVLNLHKDRIEKIANTKKVGKLAPCTFDVISIKDLEELLIVTKFKLSIL